MSASPPGVKQKKQNKSPKKSTNNTTYTSTMVSSPVPASKRASKNRTLNQFIDYDDDDDSDYGDAFEPGPSRTRYREETPGLEAPLTTQERFESLPEMHRLAVDDFVNQASEMEEKLRNDKGMKKYMFSQTDFREMAIGWTTSLEKMLKIPGIEPEAVGKHGNHFVPMLRKFESNYEEMMGRAANKPFDKNHQTVIELMSDDEDMDELGVQVTERSSYFTNSTRASAKAPTKAPASSRSLPWSVDQPSIAKSLGRSGSGGISKGKARGSRKASGSRKSNSSTGSGVSKASSRKSSEGPRKAAAPKASAGGTLQSNLMSSFGHKNSRGGGGGGRGGSSGGRIATMPA